MAQYRRGRAAPWRVPFIDHYGRRRSLSFTKRSDAQEAEQNFRRIRQRAKAGLQSDIPIIQVLFGEFSESWLSMRQKTHPESTWSQDESRLNSTWRPLFQGVFLHQISRQQIKRKLDILSSIDGLSNATVNRHRALLHTLFQSAINADPPLITVNPASGIALLSEKVKTRQTSGWKNSSNLTAYLAATYQEGDLWGAFFTLLAWTGARIGEGLALHWEDVDVARGVITARRIVDRKTGKIELRTKGQKKGGKYELLLLPIAAQALEQWRAKSIKTAPGDLVFPGPRGGHMTHDQAYTAHYNAITRACVPRITPHGLRHDFATASKKAGLTRMDVQEVLGHEDSRTTDIYFDDDIEALVEKARALRLGAPIAPVMVLQEENAS